MNKVELIIEEIKGNLRMTQVAMIGIISIVF